MNLYLIRHADALALGERGITDDAARPLSTKGEAQARQVGKILQKQGIVFDKLVTSPFVRARQTTELLLEGWEHQPEILVSEELTPDAKPRKLAKYLRKVGGRQVGLVGHLPHMGIWAGWLLGAKKAQIELAKVGIACFSCEDGPGKGNGALQWLVTPSWYD